MQPSSNQYGASDRAANVMRVPEHSAHSVPRWSGPPALPKPVASPALMLWQTPPPLSPGRGRASFLDVIPEAYNVPPTRPNARDALCGRPNVDCAARATPTRFASPGSCPGESVEATALGALRKLTKRPDALWRGAGQKMLAEAIVERKQDVVGVLATGSGKTYVSLLAAVAFKKQATLIVVPLKSLLADYKRRLRELGLGFDCWEAGRDSGASISPLVNLCLVQVEQTKHSAFLEALQRWNEVRAVTRIVFDEAHFGIFETWRKACRDLYQLRKLPAQLILITATLPPQATEAALAAYGVSPQHILIRCSTTRPSLGYRVDAACLSSQMLGRLKVLMEGYEPQLQGEDRGLIFTFSCEDATNYSRELGCLLYVGPKSDEERMEAVHRWHRGLRRWDRWMVCTSAFSAGCDYPAVRVVLHAGIPASFVDYVQSVGRGGRDGRHTSTHIIPFAKDLRPPAPYEAAHPHDSAQRDVERSAGAVELKLMVQQAVKGERRCLREQISRWADGEGAPCAADGSMVLCQACDPGEAGPVATLRGGTTFQARNCLLVPQQRQPSRLPIQPRPATEAGQATWQANGTIVDGCRKRPAEDPFEEASILTTKRAVSEKRYAMARRRQLRDALDLHVPVCGFCNTLNGGRMDHIGDDKAMLSCRTLHRFVGNQGASRKFVSFCKSIRYSPDVKGHCWSCHVPQGDGLHPQIPKGGRCSGEYGDVISGTLYAIWMDDRESGWRARAAARFGQGWKSDVDFGQWLARLSEPGGWTNAALAFLWWCEELQQ